MQNGYYSKHVTENYLIIGINHFTYKDKRLAIRIFGLISQVRETSSGRDSPRPFSVSVYQPLAFHVIIILLTRGNHRSRKLVRFY